MVKTTMRVLISIGHPAQVHQFKYVYREMKLRGHDLLFFAKNKEMTYYLLDKYQLPYISVKKKGKGIINKIINIPNSCFQAFKVLRKYKPDIVLSRGYLPIVWVSWLMRIKQIYFTDTEHVAFADMLTIPFVNCKVTSTSFNKDLGANHIRYRGIIELFYLHPKYYEVKKNETRKKKKILLRFVAWDAYHDVGYKGLSFEFKSKLISTLLKYGEVLISSEKKLPEKFEKYRVTIKPEEMHQLLSEVDLFIGEGASMASECGCIGTPAIYVNPLSTGYIDELEEYGLVSQYRNYLGVFEKAVELLELENLEELWLEKKEKFLFNCIAPTALTVWFVENYPESAEILKKDPNYQLRFK